MQNSKFLRFSVIFDLQLSLCALLLSRSIVVLQFLAYSVCSERSELTKVAERMTGYYNKNQLAMVITALAATR